MNANDSKAPAIRPTDGAWEYHRPVLVEEVLWALAPAPGRVIVDGTLGGGGHAAAILQKGAKIIGLDQDGGAIGYCIQHLVGYDADSVRLE
ncbi:MAG: 16S rRNA (cytosine(1402)-N(4))-methyltransferase, partial [Rhodospirillales bacterium]|nr:16S rRNA (cytosine(1402)-N(4))-methyltransferase [Acetobacter sp.]